MEGWRPAARKERWKVCAVLKFSRAVCAFKRFIRRAGRSDSTADILPAAAEKRRSAAAFSKTCRMFQRPTVTREALWRCASPLGAVGTDGAHFRLDIAAKAPCEWSRVNCPSKSKSLVIVFNYIATAGWNPTNYL